VLRFDSKFRQILGLHLDCLCSSYLQVLGCSGPKSGSRDATTSVIQPSTRKQSPKRIGNRSPRRSKNEPRIDSNEHKILCKEEVFQIVGCAMEVLNALGHGRADPEFQKDRNSNGSDWFCDFIRVHSCSFVVLFFIVSMV